MGNTLTPTSIEQYRHYLGRAVDGFVASGGIPAVPASSLTLAAFATTGFVIDDASSLVAVVQDAQAFTLPSSGDGTYWLLLWHDTSTDPAGWTRSATTATKSSAYRVQKSATRPSTPLGGVLLARLTVSGGVVTVVQPVFPSTAVTTQRIMAMVNVQDYGAQGDGVTDDTYAFESAMAVSKRIYIPDPSVSYLLKGAITLPTDTWLIGANKRTTKLQHAVNAAMLTMGNGAGLFNLYLEGDGDNYTGVGLAFGGTNGNQVIEHCRILNFQGEALSFSELAGSRVCVHDLEVNRWNIATHAQALTGSGLFSIAISSVPELSAVPRKFSMIESNGGPTFSFGGCNNVFVSDSFLADLAYDPDSRGVRIVSCRIANQAALDLDGHQNGIVGCDIAPALTLVSGTDDWSLVGNAYNGGPVTDNSGNGRNRVESQTVAYTPTWTATAGTAPAIGNGTLKAHYSRINGRIQVSIELTIGSTTTVGSAGNWRFSVPVAFLGDTGFSTVQVGSCTILDASAVARTFPLPRILQGTSYIEIELTTGGLVSFNAPYTWATGDIVRLTLSYDV